jgi:hypothetical protein
MYMPVIPAVPYLFIGLARYSVNPRISRDALVIKKKNLNKERENSSIL